ncbi:AraC-like DNA-binding protein [Filimonas zeae]|uniref:Transcriptional regulator n=1 Tax=Filimonas zeae TaxID=1737353 RepID=A0A917J2U7_9BACT|nr:AraC family transcriptional regulator [Filimonas zeae]MDR6342190.1 AraC-like DNA-binding protein [Filimonas zeae]GGH78756.1 transcriptional regulator [Filimonas zeae]
MNRREKMETIAESIAWYSKKVTISQSAWPHGQHPYFALLAAEGVLPVGGPVKTDHYILAVCMRGQGTMLMDETQVAVQPGSFFMIPPNYRYGYVHGTEDLLLYCILFKKEFLDEAVLKQGVLEQLLLSEAEAVSLLPENARVVEDVMRRMYEECHKEDGYALPILRLQLLELLYEVQRLHTANTVRSVKPVTRSAQLAQEYRRLVDEKFTDLRTVQEYASLLHVSPKYLSELVRNETGESALHIIHRRICREAAYLLQYTQATVKEVADQLHFDTPSHFSRFFKQVAGYNPSEVKKELMLPDTAA